MNLYSCLCNIYQVIDDSLFESPEEFELRLSDSSYNAKIGTLSSATVIIDGPNDGKSLLFLINFEKLNDIKNKFVWLMINHLSIGDCWHLLRCILFLSIRVKHSLGPASLPFRWGCWWRRAGDHKGGVWPLPHISGVVRHPPVRTTFCQSRGGLYTKLYTGHLQSRPGFTGMCMSGLTWETHNIFYTYYKNGVPYVWC